MKYILFLNTILFAALCMACNNSSTANDRSAVSIPANLKAPAAVVPDTTVPKQPVQVQTSPAVTQPSTATIQSIQPVTNIAPGLNPAHGQPGHRCDIAVGAPLNSNPATPVVNTSTQPVVTKTTPVTVTSTQPSLVQKPTVVNTNDATVSKAGLNPEHGKPGHRCDIAVGAPFDSKPNATPTITSQPANNTTVTPVTPSISQPVTPILPAGSNTTPVVVTGLNPEHGKPGHRCDIAVGAPLNSKPVEIKKENK